MGEWADMLREHSPTPVGSCTVDGPQATSCPITQTCEHPSTPALVPSETLVLDGFREGLLTAHPLLVTLPMENSKPLRTPAAQPATAASPECHVSSRAISPSLVTTPNPSASSASRDALLAYAYHLYSSPGRKFPGLTPIPLADIQAVHTSPEQVYRLRLLPILSSLHSSHPTDLVISLLLSCTYHALGDYNACLRTSQDILRINPDYAEAMNNIATTLKVLGRHDQAYDHWWKAIQIQPTYWDAIDNILSFLFALAHSARDANQRSVQNTKALDVCTFVRRKVLSGSGRLLLSIPTLELPRLQKVLLTSGILLNMHQFSATAAIVAYFQAIELVISPPIMQIAGTGYSTRELILSSFLAMYLLQPPDGDHLPLALAQCLGLPEDASCSSLIASHLNLFDIVRNSGDRLVYPILHLGSGALPFMLLAPEQANRLPDILFPSSAGVLPAICMQDAGGTLQPPVENRRRDANIMTSAILLALARRYQDLQSTEVHLPGFSGTLNVNHALSIMFYYLALSLAPSPSTYNNIGIVLSTISTTSRNTDQQGTQTTLSGWPLAKQYYLAGLQLDPAHPHLLTNLGSLYKDQGDLDEAIKLYSKALAVKPDFDVALANMGNAVEDSGRPWEALEYYRRAIDLNPDLPEAVCGLMNAMASVCDWRGRTCYMDEYGVDEQGNLLEPASTDHLPRPGLTRQMLDICDTQLDLGYFENVHAVSASRTVEEWLHFVEMAYGRMLREDERAGWHALVSQFRENLEQRDNRINEGGFVMRLNNWICVRLQRQWYVKTFGKALNSDHQIAPGEYGDYFIRPALPRNMSPPAVPSILPFNTFIYPLTARLIRLISHRNALRITFTAMSQPWLPQHVYPPPPPPVDEVLNIGYVTNDINNHPLSHLMQSVFGLHDRTRFRVFIYSTSPWDGTSYRPRISDSVEFFVDASTWSSEEIVKHIIDHGIHVLINLGGYTKGARNDVFAARPCPVQIQLIGYAGTLGAGWCDYLVSDTTASPRELCAAEFWRKKGDRVSKDPQNLDLGADLDPESAEEEWVYSEKMIYMPHTFMVADHKQSFRSDENLNVEERAQTTAQVLWRDEEMRRQEMRQSVFPDLQQDAVIFANFNQLYKIDPDVFAIWLHILHRVPNSILWLLRFPPQGEEHLLRTAKHWAGDAVASRIRFTHVARKDVHVYRGRIADLFLDTIECNAHTITADIIWSGTPIVTFPKHRHKMCSRVAASMANGTGFGDEMVVNSIQEYEERAVTLANSIQYATEIGADGATLLRGHGELMKLRRNIFLNRDRMPLFDTVRWTRNIEKAYREAWRRWVEGTQFELSDEWVTCQGPEKESGCIWVQDDDPVEVVRYD